MAEVISLDDVYIALSSSKPTLYKAIVSLILSSGINASIISKLTLYDFLYACEEYFEQTEDKTFENLLKKDPWELVPCWKLKSDGRITFSTPESTFYLFLYLKEKRMDDLDNLNNPLFKRGDNNFLTSSKISSYVTEFNKVLGTEKNYFKSKNLINTFDSICYTHLYFEKEYKNNLMDLFEGKISNKSKLFKKYLENSKEIKKDYESIIPYLTARNYNFDKYLEYYLSLKKDNSDKKGLLLNYYKNNLEEKLQSSYDQSKLLLKFAEELLDEDSFIGDELYLNKLFKKAIVRLILYNYDFTYLKHDLGNISPDISLKRREHIFKVFISKLKLFNFFEIDNWEINRACIDYLVDNNYYSDFILVSNIPKIVEGIIFKLIDDENEISSFKNISFKSDFEKEPFEMPGIWYSY
jgi:hypothetical protein